MSADIFILKPISDRQRQVLDVLWRHTLEVGPPSLARLVEWSAGEGVPPTSVRGALARLEAIGAARQLYPAGPWVPQIDPDGNRGELRWVPGATERRASERPRLHDLVDALPTGRVELAEEFMRWLADRPDSSTPPHVSGTKEAHP